MPHKAKPHEARRKTERERGENWRKAQEHVFTAFGLCDAPSVWTVSSSLWTFCSLAILSSSWLVFILVVAIICSQHLRAIVGSVFISSTCRVLFTVVSCHPRLVTSDVDASGPRKLPFGCLSVYFLSIKACYAPWIALIECFMLPRAWGWAWEALLPVV